MSLSTSTHTHTHTLMHTPYAHLFHTPSAPPPHMHSLSNCVLSSSHHRNVLLYYSTGVTLGIVASILILLYVFSKFVPKVGGVRSCDIPSLHTHTTPSYHFLHTHLHRQFDIHKYTYFQIPIFVAFSMCMGKGKTHTHTHTYLAFTN